MKIRCMIIDDEPMAVNLLSEYISQVNYLDLSHKCYNALEALSVLKKDKVDLIFADINMPQLSGIQFATLLPRDQLFVFTTAYSEFAVESYEMQALDYLLKPITFERFLKSIHKAKDLLGRVDEQYNGDQQLVLKIGRSMVQLQYRDIYFIEGLKDYVIFHTEQTRHIVYKRMKELEETLPPQFSRVHNSYIINRDHLQKMEDNQVYLQGNKIPVSDKYREEFLRKMQTRLL